jgi:hypothetical protein
VKSSRSTALRDDVVRIEPLVPVAGRPGFDMSSHEQFHGIVLVTDCTIPVLRIVKQQLPQIGLLFAYQSQALLVGLFNAPQSINYLFVFGSRDLLLLLEPVLHLVRVVF